MIKSKTRLSLLCRIRLHSIHWDFHHNFKRIVEKTTTHSKITNLKNFLLRVKNNLNTINMANPNLTMKEILKKSHKISLDEVAIPKAKEDWESIRPRGLFCPNYQ